MGKLLESGPGRMQGRLELGFALGQSGRTQLNKRFRTGLYHFAKPYWDGRQLMVQVLNPTAGIFEGDSMESEVCVETGARGCLLSPSSTQVYSMPGGGAAQQRQHFTLSGDGSLAVIPRWLVLHKGARFRQSTLVELDLSSSLFFVEMVSAGRSAFGEFLEYEEYSSEVVFRRAGKLVLREGFTCGHAHNRWFWESPRNRRAYLASVYISFPGAMEACVQVQESLSALNSDTLDAGLTEICQDFVVVRLFASDCAEITAGINRICHALESRVPVSPVQGRIL